MSFTIFDIIVLLILTASALLGMYRGFIKVTIGFTAFILSLIFAYYLYPYVVDFLSKHLENEVILMLLSAAISYILSLTVCSFVSSKLACLVQVTCGGVTDRFLGLIAGLTRGSAICLVLFAGVATVTTKSYIAASNLNDVLTNASEDKYPCWLKESLSTQYLSLAYKTTLKMVPDNYLEEIKLLPESSEDSEKLLEKTFKKKREHIETQELQNNAELDSELEEVQP